MKPTTLLTRKRIEHSRDTVRSRLERQLIDSVVSFGRKSTSLTRLEIHHLCAFPGHVTPTMVFENLLTTLAQHRERNAEAAIGCLRAGDRLEQKIDRCAVAQGGKLRLMCARQQVWVGTSIGIDETIERVQD